MNKRLVISCATIALFVSVSTYLDSDAAVLATADSSMISLADRADMTQHGKIIFLRAHPELLTKQMVQEKCSGSDTSEPDGCYDPNTNKIYLRDMPSEFDAYEAVIAAHEMLHAACDVDANCESLASLLTAELAAGGHEKVVDELNDYNFSSQGEKLDEIHSFLGTQSLTISQELEDHYSKYFFDRQSVVSNFDATLNLFTNTEKQLSDLSAEIESAQLTAERLYSYHQKAARYGDSYYARYYYDQYTKQYAFIQSKIDSYNGQVNDYNALVESFSGKPVSQISLPPVSQ